MATRPARPARADPVDGPHDAPIGAPDEVTVHTGPGAGGYELPALEGAALYDDVGPRQQ